MRCIEATYKNSDYFHIPSSIPLLSVEDNNKVKRNEKVAWSWHVRWGTLFYLDVDLKEQEIDACNKASENDNIIPDELYEQEEDDGVCWKWENDCPASEEVWFEECVDCEKLMGGKKFTNEEEFDEHPDRDDGYDDDGDWHCPECKNEDEESDNDE